MPHTWSAILVITLVLGGSGIPRAAQASIPESPHLWVSRYNGPHNNVDSATSIAASSDGSKVFVTGISRNLVTYWDVATVAYNISNGSRLWVARHNIGNVGVEPSPSLAVSPDGSKVFVTAGSLLGSVTLAYDASNGAVLWSASGGNAAVVSADSATVYITGDRFITAARNSANGVELWRADYDAGNYDTGIALALGPNGTDVYVTGYGSAGQGGYDFATVAYDASTGSQKWATRYDGPTGSFDHAKGLVVSPDGLKVLVTGISWNAPPWGSFFDYTTVAYNAATGSQVWQAIYDGPGKYFDYVNSLAISPDGSKVFVTGASYGLSYPERYEYTVSHYDYATVAYEVSTGSRLWISRYDAAGKADWATSLAVSPDGSKIFVTGRSGGLYSSNDYATLVYDASNGVKIWVARYNGPQNDEDVANSLTVTADGTKIFVTGRSGDTEVDLFGTDLLGTTVFADYATIAYGANSCASGGNERGPISSLVKEALEPHSSSAAPFVHGINCEVVVPLGQ